MAELLLDDQFREGNAEVVQGPVAPDMAANPVQELGRHSVFLLYTFPALLTWVTEAYPEAGFEGPACYAAASYSQVNQEPSAILWTQVAAE